MTLFKIMLCGDSISRGVVYDTTGEKYMICKNSYSNILAERSNTEIFNISSFGNTVKRAENKFNRMIGKVNPDIVIFGLGGNDCDFEWDEVAKKLQENHPPKTDMDIFKATLISMIDKVIGQGGKAVMMNLPPIDCERYFEWISMGDSARAENILQWLGSESRIYWWQERYNAMVLNVASEKQLDIIDVRSEFLLSSDYRDYICEDGIHPNEKGQELIAEVVKNYLDNTLK